MTKPEIWSIFIRVDSLLKAYIEVESLQIQMLLLFKF